ncbi:MULTISPECIES: phage tail sheath C-terminal domain-containing protein [unclassified Chryseobacterium]|jgi:phage tail sheath protein FI|uniref:phage tail sheath family protein n=1 Tax=unclassified Chryseobacterium TaxID=2593645 RepID=UPI001C5B4A57|nr:MULTISPECIES: phage tail sheath C-terminal domain-containing protein [unclassified Chryseobacterium]MBW3521203.1 phage tail sheath family protein [Chryseobacterium sp. NKUCC03_KSP]MCD0456823.1 phage tail sheath family protein [Chryseobacterium sp. LC2016-27]
MNYKTPGVYVEETAKFPPSVAQVETAIPAFVGYTAQGSKNEPTRISSMLEYEMIFGKAKNDGGEISVSIEDSVVTATYSNKLGIFKMYYAMQMYFANGGGPCYIVSAGSYPLDGIVKLADLKISLATLEKEDEPTLTVFPDAESLSTVEAYQLYNLALDQAEDLKDRFVIMDVLGDVSTFRTAGPSSGPSGERLKYGAAYHPKLETVLSYSFEDGSVKITSYKVKNDSGVLVSVTMPANQDNLAWLKTSNSELYNQAKKEIESKRVILAPSSSMAGVYAKVDATSGVFKAPANVGLNFVVAPIEKISHQDQEALNVDATSGKSINAIRTFTGKGPLVWGARTLDGNSNEWRYISVRRFFNMVEESVKKATERFVFEPNTANTWIRVQTMIENFLNQQWQDGALAGSKPEEAYYVSVGLNKTMSAQDILEGRMIVEIGMAAVRPAEFIVLRFSHKLQEA